MYSGKAPATARFLAGNQKTGLPFPSAGNGRRDIRIPILSLARELPRTPARGLDERKKQVFWLRGRPTHPTLPRLTQWLTRAFVARYSGATTRDFHPFPYSPLTQGLGALFTHFTTKYSGAIKELPLGIALLPQKRQCFFTQKTKFNKTGGKRASLHSIAFRKRQSKG